MVANAQSTASIPWAALIDIVESRDPKRPGELVPRTGFTGWEAPYPPPAATSWSDVISWAIRSAPFTIMFDVDEGERENGHTKHGRNTMDAAEKELGELPATFKVTSRGPGDEGGRYPYRVPEGYRASEASLNKFTDPDVNPNSDVEIIQTGHRWTWAPGTLHPKNHKPVVMYDPDGDEIEWTEVTTADIPELPKAWLDFLDQANKPKASKASVDIPEGTPCPKASAWLAKQEFGGATARGKRANSAATYLKRMAAEGHYVSEIVEKTKEELADTDDDDWADMWEKTTVIHVGTTFGDCCTWADEVNAAVLARGNWLTTPDTPQTGQSAPDKPRKRRKLVSAAEGDMKPVAWLWEPYIPAGMLTVLGGMPGTGKTQLAFGIAIDRVLNDPAKSVIVISPEDPRDSVTRPRLAAAGADMERVHFFDVREDTDDPITLRADLEELADDAREVNAGLVIFDPIVSVLEDDTDENSYKQVGAELQRLMSWCEKSGVAAMAITHTRKSDAAEQLDKIMGSRGFTSKPRSVLMASKSEANAGVRILEHAKTNVGPEGITLAYRTDPVSIFNGGEEIKTSKAVFLDELEMFALQQQSGNDDESKAAKRQVRAGEWVRKYLEDSPMNVARVNRIKADAAKEGFHERMMTTVVCELAGAYYHVDGDAKPKLDYWSLSAERHTFTGDQRRLVAEGFGPWALTARGIDLWQDLACLFADDDS